MYPAQLALLVTPKTRVTKLPCSPEGQVQCVTNLGEKRCRWEWRIIVGKELLLQRAHVSVLCRLQFTLASAAFPVSSRSGFLYGQAPRAGGGCCASSARVEYSSVASIHLSPRVLVLEPLPSRVEREGLTSSVRLARGFRVSRTVHDETYIAYTASPWKYVI